MRLLLVLFGAAILAFTVYLHKFATAVPPCPHPNFIASHLCVHCNTLDDAADFTRYRSRPTGKNTIFFGRPAFEVKTYIADRCGNVEPVRAAACTLTRGSMTTSGTYTCMWLGTHCVGEHSLSNGHLFYRDIRC